jgi:hypothetical protein
LAEEWALLLLFLHFLPSLLLIASSNRKQGYIY